MTTAADIKATVDIVEVIGDYVSLEKSGQYFKAVCPFHSEKTPSMKINEDTSSYYCFGCQAKGAVSYTHLTLPTSDLV
mgnify:CR=1 FL=1